MKPCNWINSWCDREWRIRSCRTSQQTHKKPPGSRNRDMEPIIYRTENVDVSMLYIVWDLNIVDDSIFAYIKLWSVDSGIVSMLLKSFLIMCHLMQGYKWQCCCLSIYLFVLLEACAPSFLYAQSWNIMFEDFMLSPNDLAQDSLSNQANQLKELRDAKISQDEQVQEAQVGNGKEHLPVCLKKKRPRDLLR